MESMECTIDGRDDVRTKDAPEDVPAAPTGSLGDPACPRCRGAREVQTDGGWMHCQCVIRLSKVQLVKACWPLDVLRALGRNEVRRSALEGRLGESLWIRADRDTLVAHLARGLRAAGKIELVRIASDADLVDAWLANVGDLRDDEAAAHRGEQEDRFRNVSDLAAPPKLLVLYVGVRAAQLADLPDLILEAIHVREHRGKATWVVDTSDRPLAEGRCPAWREDVAAKLAGWATVRLNSAQEVGEKDVDLTTETSSALKRRPDPELLAAAEKDGFVPKTIGKGGSIWGDCDVCGTADSRGYVRNDFGRLSKVCWPCKAAKKNKKAPVAPTRTRQPKHTAKEALRAALGIGGSAPIPVCPADLEKSFSKSSLEKALRQLRDEGHTIEAGRQEGRPVWIWQP